MPTVTSPVEADRSPSASKPASERSKVRRWTRQLHAWVGLTLSLLLFVFGASGSALVYKEAYWRLLYPEVRGPAPALGVNDHAEAFAAVVERFGERIHSIKLPEPGVSAYHLYLEGGEAFVSVGDHSVIDEWQVSERLMSLLFDLHAHLLAGENGERVGGFIALLGVLLSITGVVLWWPARRQFAARTLLPHGTSRRALVAWHRDLGLVVTPALLVLLLTGSGLVFYNATGALLNGIFGDPPQIAEPRPASGGPAVELADASILARVKEEFPQARLTFYYPPIGVADISEFRLKQPCELHPNGRSFLYLDATGLVVGKVDACAIPPGQKVLHAMYPLHAGKASSATYKLVTFLGGLALAALSVSGATAYARRLGWIGRG